MSKHPKDHKEPAPAPAAPTEKVGGSSSKGEVLRSLISPILKRLLPAIGMSDGRIHTFMAHLPEDQLELFKIGLKAATPFSAFLFSKIPLHVFAGFESPREAAETVGRIIDEFLEKVASAAESYEGAEHVPAEVLEKAADEVVAKVPRLNTAQAFRSPIELFGALQRKDKDKFDDLKSWLRSLDPEQHAKFMRFAKFIDTLNELEGLLSLDADERIGHLDLLCDFHEKFRVAEAAREFSMKVEKGLASAKDMLSRMDRQVFAPAANDLAYALAPTSAAWTMGWFVGLLSLPAALVAWLLTNDMVTTKWTLFGSAGTGLALVILGLLLRKKRAVATGFPEGMQWARWAFLKVGTMVRWGTDEVGAVKRLIFLAFTIPFLAVLAASLLNKPYVVFYTSLGAVVFAVVVLITILIDAVLAFAAARAIGAIAKTEVFSGEAVASVRDWASSTVAWYAVIFLTFMYIPAASPMAVAVIAASSLFFAAQRLAHWFHSTAGRYVAYGTFLFLGSFILSRKLLPTWDAYAGKMARTYVGGDLGLNGIEDRMLLRNLSDESREIRERAIATCGQEYCTQAEADRDADILRRTQALMKGTYWAVRNGTPIEVETVLPKDVADDLLRDLAAAKAK